MKIIDIRTKHTSRKGILGFLRESKKKLKDRRFLSVSSNVKNIREKKEIRKEVARAYTILNERHGGNKKVVKEDHGTES